MKKSILAVCLGLAGFWSVLAEDSPIAAPGRVNEQGDAELPSGELLSDHVAEAEFTGMIHRKCRFLTSLCPDKCDHARDFAVFRMGKCRGTRWFFTGLIIICTGIPVLSRNVP